MKPTYEPVGGDRTSEREESGFAESSPMRSGCLVFGLEPTRRQFLVQAARSAGWDAVECGEEQIAAGPRMFEGQHLIIFDLETPDGSTAVPLQTPTERAARQSGILLVLCGNEGNVAEEIWARQLGVWLYLPGAVDNVDLTEVFEEAMRLDEERQASRPSTASPSTANGKQTSPSRSRPR